MSLIDCFGFDYMATADGTDVSSILANAGWLEAIQPRQVTTTITPRTGRGCVGLWAGDRLRYRTPSDQATLINGFGWYASGAAEVQAFWWGEYNDGAAHNIQIQLETDLNNALVLKRGDGTTLATSAIGAITRDGWHFIEIKATIDNTNGAVIVRVDDDEVINVSGVDTQNHATAAIINQVHHERLGADKYMDDWYLCDTAGSVNNDFLGGETVVDEDLVSGAGSDSDWTPVGAASNHEAVDETISDGDTTYNSSTTDAERDSFAINDIPAGRTHVYAVKTSVVARREAGGSSDIKILQRLGATVVTSAAITLDTTYKTHSWITETKPGGGGWTPSDVNSSQHGYEHEVPA